MADNRHALGAEKRDPDEKRRLKTRCSPRTVRRLSGPEEPVHSRATEHRRPLQAVDRIDAWRDKMSVGRNNSRQNVTTMAATTQPQRVLELVRRKGIVRGAELDRLGIHRMHLKRLVDRGLLVQRARGVYEAAEPRMSEHDSVIEVAARVPKATLCLLTALRLHRLTTQNPFEIWIMIDRKARKPSINYPPIRVVRASGLALSKGVKAMRIDGVDLKVTTVAKTVADCFKYRNTVGLDVAIEALRDAWRQKKATVDDIIAAAKTDRVATVMRPYLESVV